MRLHYTYTTATAPQHERADMRSPSTSSGMRPRVSPAARRVVAMMLVAAIALEGIPLMHSQAGNRLVEEVVLWPAGFKVVGRAANVRRVRMV